MRAVIVLITNAGMASMCRKTVPITTQVEGLPEDAELVNVYHDIVAQITYLTFRHDDLEDIEDGKRLPVRKLICTAYPKAVHQEAEKWASNP